MTARRTDIENETASPPDDEGLPQESGFNLTMEEVRILAKYRALSPHQQKGILQAIELIRPAELRARSTPCRPR